MSKEWQKLIVGQNDRIRIENLIFLERKKIENGPRKHWTGEISQIKSA